MISLVLVFCLAASPKACQEVRPDLDGLSGIACQVKAEEIAQDWLAGHPKWTLGGWRCETKPPQKPA